MKCLNSNRFRLVFIGILAAMVVGGGNARADFVFGEPVNLKEVIPVIDPVHECIDCFSYDGMEIYIESFRPGGYGSLDIWVLRRDSIEVDWNPPENLGHLVNSPNIDNVCSISKDGLMLYFSSNRPGGYSEWDIYVTTRATKNDPWNEAVNIGPEINSSAIDAIPWISPDGLTLYFKSNRPGGYGDGDIYVTRRTTQNDSWNEPVNLGPEVNTPHNECNNSLSPDGLLLLFDDDNSELGPRPEGYGGSDMWMSRRANVSEPWQVPTNLGSTVNSSSNDVEPRISPDGRTLYFWTKNEANVYENWQASIEPVVDLNGDECIDTDDLLIMIDNWGTDNSLCDIGPMPWGDGIVDIEDLKVFIKYWEQENMPEDSQNN